MFGKRSSTSGMRCKSSALHPRLEIFEYIPQERISDRTQSFDVPVPQIAKETVGVVGLAPRERVQQQTVFAPTPSGVGRDSRGGRVGRARTSTTASRRKD